MDVTRLRWRKDVPANIFGNYLDLCHDIIPGTALRYRCGLQILQNG